MVRYRNKSWSLASLVLAWCLSGCSSAPEAGGEPVPTSVAPFAVRIAAASFICTGAKVAPRIFLTARHCVDGISKRIELMHAGGENRVAVTIQEVVTAPAETSVNFYDLGFLVVDQDTPAFPSVSFRVAPPALPNRVAAYGFGCDKEYLRLINLQTIPDQEFTMIYGIAPAAAPIGRLRGPDGVCNGDSGGPLVDGEGAIVGVLSRVQAADSRAVVAAKPDDAMANLVREFKASGKNPAWRDLRLAD
jgi:Trypsin